MAKTIEYIINYVLVFSMMALAFWLLILEYKKTQMNHINMPGIEFIHNGKIVIEIRELK